MSRMDVTAMIEITPDDPEKEIPSEEASSVADDVEDESAPEPPPKRLRTEDLMKGLGRRDEATPGEGILTSGDCDQDAATG